MSDEPPAYWLRLEVCYDPRSGQARVRGMAARREMVVTVREGWTPEPGVWVPALVGLDADAWREARREMAADVRPKPRIGADWGVSVDALGNVRLERPVNR